MYSHLLYFKNSILNRLFSYFKDYFSETTRPTAKNLFLILLAILTLDTFRSMRFAHRHVISKMTNTSLNAFYYTLQTDSLEHLSWNDVTTKKHFLLFQSNSILSHYFCPLMILSLRNLAKNLNVPLNYLTMQHITVLIF